MKLILEMKFKAFVLVTIAMLCLMFLFSLKWCMDWLLGLGPPPEPEPMHFTETIEETYAREVDQLSDGWSGPPAYPAIPVMLWWHPFSGDDGLQQCGEHKCFVTNDRAYRHHPMLKTVFFYGSDFKPEDLPVPRKKGEDWALFHEESPKNNPIFSHEPMMNQFNHTATFRKGSDMSLSTQYLEDLEMITEQRFSIPVTEKNRMMAESGLAPVAYVQSGCDTPSDRDLWVGELMKHVKVDSYGSCLNNKNIPEEIRGSEKMKEMEYLALLAKYKFVIAIENAVCEDYVTEKLWRTLQVGAVPIYLGAPNIKEYLPHTKAAILVKDFDSVEGVAKHILRLNSDDDEYIGYLGHKQVRSPIQNQWLVETIGKRRWGVTSSQQAAMGNFVKHFQCLVCERVANNVWFSNLGFRPLPYDASKDHYGCPVPSNPLTGKVDTRNWWVQQWFNSLYEAEALENLLRENQHFNSTTFYRSVEQHRKWRS